MMSSGSTVFFFDFDIFSMEPISSGSPVEANTALRSSAVPSIFTLAGSIHSPFLARYVSCTTMPWVKSPANGSSISMCPVFRMARVKKRE